MSLSYVSVISNALRLKAVRLQAPIAINPPSPAPRHLPNGGAAATSRANLP
jgi:hypothetical protein